jgi:hypothetical protein
MGLQSLPQLLQSLEGGLRRPLRSEGVENLIEQGIEFPVLGEHLALHGSPQNRPIFGRHVLSSLTGEREAQV